MKLDSLILHEKTRKQAEQLLAKPPHAVLLTGDEGSGRRTLAVALSARILADEDTDTQHPMLTIIEPVNNAIPIDAIRDVQRFLQLKTIGTAEIRRIVIIVDANSMGAEAQNALLKTLEEPPHDTLLILTTTGTDELLPTIVSRARTLPVLPIGKNDAAMYFTGYPEAAVRSAWALSGGNIGLMSALLEDSEHALAVSVKEAKELLGASQFERLSRVEVYAKDKEALGRLLIALSRIAISALEEAAVRQQTAAIKRWLSITRAVEEARTDFSRNANSKLLLTDLCLRL